MVRDDFMADGVLWWNSEEAAEYVRRVTGAPCSARAVNDWGSRGYLMSRRWGRHRYLRTSVEAFVEETICRMELSKKKKK